MEKKRILVVGGAGFIGSRVVGKLLGQGHEVSVFDLYHQFSPPDDANYYNALGYRKQFLTGTKQTIRGDARNATDVQEAIEMVQPQRIVHLAAVTHAPYNEAYLMDAVTSTQIPIANLFKAVQLAAVPLERFLLVSSSMSYGDFQTPIIDEEHPQNPLTVYGSLKYSAEILTKPLAHLYGIAYTIVRPQSVYGASDLVGKLAMQKLKHAIVTGEYPVGSYSDDGTDYTHVENTSEGIVLALLSDRAVNQAFNISRCRSRPIGDVIHVLNDLGFDVRAVNTRPKSPLSGTPTRGAMSHEKASALLGFAPRIDLEEGLIECVHYLQDYEGLNKPRT